MSAHRGQVAIYDAPLTGETKANARLIAAAPDMAEALRVALAYSHGWQDDDVDVVRSALAKAGLLGDDRPCRARIDGTQNLCTRPAGHEGPHRCKASDVDAREAARA